jgi:hypothetical protein
MTVGAAKFGLFAAAGSGASPYAAYMFGGLEGPTEYDGIDKLDFATETKSTLVAVIATASYSAASASNNGTAGYTWGGVVVDATGTRTNETNKLDYATETISAATVLAENRAWQVGVANSPTNAYMAGGTTSAGVQSWVHVWTFSSDTWAADATSLSSATYGMAPMSDNGSYGYWAGGYGPLTRIDRTDFSDGTLSTIVATLPSEGNQIGGASNSGTAGYAYGGYSDPMDENNKLTYAGETVSTLALGASFKRYGTAGASNSGTAAYWFCGLNAAHARTDSILTTAYATDTTSLVATGTNSLGYAAAVANCESL